MNRQKNQQRKRQSFNQYQRNVAITPSYQRGHKKQQQP